MNKTFSLLACAALAAFAAGTAAAQKGGDAKKKLYCWNENGQRICGDALPANAVDRERTEINAASGLATARIARAPTPAEQAAAAAAAEAERAAALQAEAQARRDRAMAEVYATEADLRRAFAERIAVMDETIKASRLGIEGRRQSLISLLRRAGENELNGKAVPKATADGIRAQHAQLLQQQTVLAQQMQERATIDQDLQLALARYHALKRPGQGG
ncbi:hypothetical protein [Vulcaniibacterium tengchongense]|uniref:DUF4124 domain-containing protein n=1 Tax=Vulcaniibacterium tengchongense TaxID=1273429 RepID=A0A3N4UX76_9GAMM|nr:hypothetical protein [Vulcaniibacterium tengchongense]RPE74718.1 hypothetical protein EDC50_3130 [Vulcaniibacterium tengchongense]